MTLDHKMEHYQDLAFNYGVPLYQVLALADLLGPEEDYDGLVGAVEDLADQIYKDDQPDEAQEWFDFDPDC